MGAKAKRIEGRSQATPFAEDYIQQLQGLMGSALGTGVGPLQQGAGTAIQQFVESGGGQFDLSPLVGNLQDIFRRETDRGAAQVRESMGALGGRFGTPLAREEGRFRREAGTDFMAGLGDLFRQEFGAQQNRLLQGIGMMQGFGAQNLQPFQQLAGTGILPDQVIMQQNPWMQGLGAIGDIAGMIPGIGTAINAGTDILGMFGGGGGGFNFGGTESPFVPS